jgi:predicted dehydrogenase
MKIIVTGLGSMGRRRIRLIRGIDPAIHIVGADTNPARQREAEAQFGIETFSSMEHALADGNADAVFVSTAPLSHAALIEKALMAGCHIFTEINLVTDGYAHNTALAREKGLVLFLSSTMLYRREIRYIKERCAGQGTALSYLYHVGQYLPDWHPWESYQDFFVSEPRSNGCRELMAIEFPWLTDSFGRVVSVQKTCGNMTELKIGTPDFYQLLIGHENGISGVFCVDIASQKAVRNLEVYGADLHISWDGTPEGLQRYEMAEKQSLPIRLYEQGVTSLSAYNQTVVEDAYLHEIEHFFRVLSGTEEPLYDFEQDQEILNLIDEIEEMDERKEGRI